MKKVQLKRENIYKGYLILVNPSYLLKDNSNELVPYSLEYPDIELEKKCNYQLQLALDDIKASSNIVPVSGYRTRAFQQQIWDDSLRDNGLSYTQKFVALVDASEHQTGLAIDLALNEGDIDFICPSFPYEGICNEFRKSSVNFGFIQRYKNEKKSITKISEEEWHFRYVGYPHSKIITDKDFCLEEYIDFIKEYPYPEKHLDACGYQISYIPYVSEDEVLELDDDSSISGNNVDGFILTKKVS